MNETSATETANGKGAAESGRDWSSPGRFAVLLAVMIFAAFWDVLLGLDTFVVRDFGLFSYPVACFQRQCFWRGEIPFWNPLSCCGLPFLAQFNTLALYPLSLIYLLLPLSWSLPFFCLLHLFIGGMGMYFLAARWTGSRAGAALAGVVFAFNGLALNFMMWPSHIATFAWIPWVILLTESGWKEGGRKLVLASLAAAMQILGGGPESILFTWLFLLALALIECVKGEMAVFVLARRFILMGLIAAGLAAAQLLPFVDFVLHCHRDTKFAASEWSMPPWGWGNFLVPKFETWTWLGMSLQLNQYWTSSYYVGIGTVFLAPMALRRRGHWRVWLLAGFLAASLVLALGDNGGVYALLRKLLPFLGLFRFPIKFVILTSALFPLLAAFAVSQYEKTRTDETLCSRGELMGIIALIALMGVIVWFAAFHPIPGSSWQDAMLNGLERLGLMAVLLFALQFFVCKPAQRRWSVLLLVLICWIDLLTALPWQNPTVDASVYDPALAQLNDKLNPVPNVATSRLILSSAAAHEVYFHPRKDLKTTYLVDRASFMSDCNLIDGFPKVDGFFSLYLRNVANVMGPLDSCRGAQLDHILDFLGVSQTIAPGKVFDWVARTNCLPIVSAGQAPIFADDRTAYEAILQTNVDFRKVVYLPSDAKSQVNAKGETVQIISKEFTPNKETIQVDSPEAAMVYVSQAYYHNWRAEVDGKPTTLWRANFAFQAVEVPPGRHEVVLVYKDRLFWIGTVFGALAFAICVFLWTNSTDQKEAHH